MLVGTDSPGSKGKHRAAGLGTSLYPVYNLTFNEPEVWNPQWYRVKLPDGEQDVHNFVQSAWTSHSTLSKENNAGLSHGDVRRSSTTSSSQGRWVYAHNLSTETVSETDEEEVIANLRAEERTRRKGKNGRGSRDWLRWTNECSLDEEHPVPDGQRHGR